MARRSGKRGWPKGRKKSAAHRAAIAAGLRRAWKSGKFKGRKRRSGGGGGRRRSTGGRKRRASVSSLRKRKAGVGRKYNRTSRKTKSGRKARSTLRRDYTYLQARTRRR